MKAKNIIPNIILNICITFFKLPVNIISSSPCNWFLNRNPLQKYFWQVVSQYYSRSFTTTLKGIFLRAVIDSYKQITIAINVIVGIRMFMFFDFLSLLFVCASWISTCFYYASDRLKIPYCEFHTQNTQYSYVRCNHY